MSWWNSNVDSYIFIGRKLLVSIFNIQELKSLCTRSDWTQQYFSSSVCLFKTWYALKDVLESQMLCFAVPFILCLSMYIWKILELNYLKINEPGKVIIYSIGKGSHLFSKIRANRKHRMVLNFLLLVNQEWWFWTLELIAIFFQFCTFLFVSNIFDVLVCLYLYGRWPWKY